MPKLLDSQNNVMSVSTNILKYKGNRYVSYERSSKEKDVDFNVFIKVNNNKYFLVNK